MIREENTEEAEVLKKVLLGIKLTVSVGNMEKQLCLTDLFESHDIIQNERVLCTNKATNQCNTFISDNTNSSNPVTNESTQNDHDLSKTSVSGNTGDDNSSNPITNESTSSNPVTNESTQNDLSKTSDIRDDTAISSVTNKTIIRRHATMDSHLQAGKKGREDEVPRFFKKDILSILHEKNDLKEQLDNIQEELEEWKKAAIQCQEQLNKVESELAVAREKLGGYAYATELEANVIGALPRGQNFRPCIVNEAVDIYITDVEVVGYTQLRNKFVFSIQVTWCDKKRFEVYRGYGEFFTFQNTLLLLFPKEAGKHKSSERIIPTLPTADNILAILGGTNKRSIVESRLQLISDYCTIILLNMPTNLSRSEFVKDFFKAKPGDKQLDALQRPKRHSLELSVYPLVPEGQSLDICVAIADFDTTEEGQLALKTGESVKIVERNESGWWFAQHTETDQYGYVPGPFLRKIGESGLPLSPTTVSDVLGFVGSLRQISLNNSYSHTAESDSHATSVVPSLMLLEYIAIDDYETDDSKQISFPERAILTVIEKSEDGWWFATYKNKEGWVPSTYLEPCSRGIQELDVESSVTVNGQWYVTIQSYTAKDVDEISLPSGIKVQVLEKSLSGWWNVKYKKKTGYVPAVILKPQIDDTTISGIEESLHMFTHSVSGIKKPPPRRKFLLETIEKRRAQTMIMEPIEEVEEPEPNRRQSIKGWVNNLFRKDTMEKDKLEKESKSVRRQSGPMVTNDKPIFIGERRPRSEHITELDYQQEQKPEN